MRRGSISDGRWSDELPELPTRDLLDCHWRSLRLHVVPRWRFLGLHGSDVVVRMRSLRGRHIPTKRRLPKLPFMPGRNLPFRHGRYIFVKLHGLSIRDVLFNARFGFVGVLLRMRCRHLSAFCRCHQLLDLHCWTVSNLRGTGELRRLYCWDILLIFGCLRSFQLRCLRVGLFFNLNGSHNFLHLLELLGRGFFGERWSLELSRLRRRSVPVCNRRHIVRKLPRGDISWSYGRFHQLQQLYLGVVFYYHGCINVEFMRGMFSRYFPAYPRSN